MSKDKCFYCNGTGYIKGKEVVPGDKLPDQMCPYCEIGQAVIKGYDKANSIQLGNYEELKTKSIELQAKVERQGKKLDVYYNILGGRSVVQQIEELQTRVEQMEEQLGIEKVDREIEKTVDSEAVLGLRAEVQKLEAEVTWLPSWEFLGCWRRRSQRTPRS